MLCESLWSDYYFVLCGHLPQHCAGDLFVVDATCECATHSCLSLVFGVSNLNVIQFVEHWWLNICLFHCLTGCEWWFAVQCKCTPVCVLCCAGVDVLCKWLNVGGSQTFFFFNFMLVWWITIVHVAQCLWYNVLLSFIWRHFCNCFRKSKYWCCVRSGGLFYLCLVNSSLPQLAGSCGIVSGLMVRLFAVVVARCEGGSLFFLVLIGATNLVRETRSFWSRFGLLVVKSWQASSIISFLFFNDFNGL
jgi:hypothetical protein